jgi:hypothetical protein
MFRRFGVDLSDQTLCGWMAQCTQLLEPLHQRLKRYVLASKFVGTDDTPVKAPDRKLSQARKGRIRQYPGDRSSPNCVVSKERRGSAVWTARSCACCANMDRGWCWISCTPTC